MNPDDTGPTLLLIVLILMIKAFYAACEAAITEISEAKIRCFENGSKQEKRLFKLLNKPAKLNTTFSFNRIFSVTILAYLSLAFFWQPFTDLFDVLFKEFAKNEWIDIIKVVLMAIVIGLISVVVITVCCDGIPRRLVCSKDNDSFALFCVPFVEFLIIISTPITAISNLVISLVARLFGVKNSDSLDSVTEEEILMMVDAGNETGVIEPSQREMINNIIEFNDLIASDVMTHRTDIIAVSAKGNAYDVVNASISSGFSRIPVYEKSIDHIIGIICIKDLLCMIGSDSAASVSIKDFIREVIYLPESVPCAKIFKELSENNHQIAIIVDEYGGTAGLVSLEDVIEAIVGDIQDEYDDDVEDIIQTSADTFIINGLAKPEDVLHIFGIDLPDDNEFDTMSGFIVSLLGRIPNENENPTVSYKNISFTVLLTEDMCISKIKAKILLEKEGKNNTDLKENEKNDI